MIDGADKASIACSDEMGGCHELKCPYADFGADNDSSECHEMIKEDCKIAAEIQGNEKLEWPVPGLKIVENIARDDRTTRDILMELWNDGGNMIIGYKPNDGYKQWLVGHIVNFDWLKASITIVGISTGVTIEFLLDRDSRLIKWTGGPTAELICTEAVGSYKLGKCYWIRDGKLRIDPSEEGRPATDGRFAGLDDEFIKKHFVEYKGDRVFRSYKNRPYLNGWLICTEGNCNGLKVTAGYRYRINYGDFKDDDGYIRRGFTDSVKDMHTLNCDYHFVYVPDEEE